MTQAGQRSSRWGRVAGTALAVLLATGVAMSQAPASSPAPEKPAEQVYKNIQVLKGMPASQLIPTMQFMSGSLGVPCEHCHVDPRDSDAKKEKQTARKMITMMRAINRDNFQDLGEVTCYSCHNGQAKPAMTPAIAQAAWVAQMTPPAAPASPPSVDDLFARYLKAVGGREAAEAVKTRVYKGKGTGYDGNDAPQSASFEMYAAAPSKLLVVTQTTGGPASTGYDGSSGWTKNPRGLRPMAGRELELMRDRVAAFQVIQLEDYVTTKVTGKEKMNGREAWVVEATRRGASPETLWFDAENGLLLRKRTLVATAFGAAPLETDFADYRAVGRVKLPFRVTSGTLSSGVVREFSEIKLNAPVEDSKFAMPAAAK